MIANSCSAWRTSSSGAKKTLKSPFEAWEDGFYPNYSYDISCSKTSKTISPQWLSPFLSLIVFNQVIDIISMAIHGIKLWDAWGRQNFRSSTHGLTDPLWLFVVIDWSNICQYFPRNTQLKATWQAMLIDQALGVGSKASWPHPSPSLSQQGHIGPLVSVDICHGLKQEAALPCSCL